MRGRTAGTELSLVVAAILLGLNFVAIKIAVVSIPLLLVGVVSSVIVLNEAFGPLRMLGAAVILGGVYLASR
jgi:hypothetical protein